MAPFRVCQVIVVVSLYRCRFSHCCF